MDGVLIYWFGWMFWIIVHFFWKNTSIRFWNSMFILFFLSMLTMTISVSNQSISSAFIFFLFYLCWWVRKYSFLKLGYCLLASLTIGAAYSAFHLMMIFDPVIAFLDENWMSACIVSALAFFLANYLKTRFHLALLGLMQGDFLLSLVKKHVIHVNHLIGSLQFFDKVALVSLIYGGCWCLLYVTMKLKQSTSSPPPLEQSS